MKTLTIKLPLLGQVVAVWHHKGFTIMKPLIEMCDNELCVDCGRLKVYLTSPLFHRKERTDDQNIYEGAIPPDYLHPQ